MERGHISGILFSNGSMSTRTTSILNTLQVSPRWQVCCCPCINIPRRHLRKRKSLTVVGQFWVPCGISSGSSVTLLDSLITQVSLRTSLYCWVCQMLCEISFHIINIYSLSAQISLQSYCNTCYSRGGVNQMWILKTSIDLLRVVDEIKVSLLMQ